MSNINLAKITRARQITIPKEICEHLKLTPGDQLLFTVADNGRVIISRAQDLLESKKVACRPSTVKVALTTQRCTSSKLRKLI